MNVKLNCGRVGDGFSHAPGDVIDVPDDEGQRMVDSGIADCVGGSRVAVVQNAMVTPPENAAASNRPRNRRK